MRSIRARYDGHAAYAGIEHANGLCIMDMGMVLPLFWFVFYGFLS